MSNKTPRARHRKFLEKGFYPPELPPCFVTRRYHRFRNDLWTSFKKLPANKKSGRPDYEHFKAEKYSFWFPRFGKEDRAHSIINPVSYFFISKLLSDNWIALQKHFRQAQYSLSKPVFDWSGERVFVQPSFDSREFASSHRAAVYNFICETDIARYYHSIYTHSVPWALHNKATAKANRKPSLWGNILDTLLRNAQDGQTVGIPVGPDTSRVVGEIIGVAIDKKVNANVRAEAGQATRFVDDYSVGCNTGDLSP